MKNYLMIYFTETDGDPTTSYVNANEIRKIIKEKHLTRTDFCIIEGTLVKSFDNSSFDFKNLK